MRSLLLIGFGTLLFHCEIAMGMRAERSLLARDSIEDRLSNPAATCEYQKVAAQPPLPVSPLWQPRGTLHPCGLSMLVLAAFSINPESLFGLLVDEEGLPTKRPPSVVNFLMPATACWTLTQVHICVSSLFS